jgi:hypothetical protein
MTALPYESPQFPPQLPFADQRGGMKAMGVILIVLGGFAGCLGLMTVPLMLAASRMPMPAGQAPPVMPRVLDVVLGVAIYVGVAALLISVGVGSLRVRRWSRAAALILTGSWALAGLLTVVSFIVMAPGMKRVMANAAAAATTMPAGGGAGATAPPAAAAATATSAGLVMAMAFMVLVGVLLPAGLFLFYRRASVRQTIDYFAPGPTWTDRCPTPVLAASAWLIVGALMTLVFGAKGAVPAFGMMLTGLPAVAMCAGLAILNASLAVGLFRLRPVAWWVTLLAMAVGLTSVLLTFARVDPFEVQRLSGTPPEQIEILRQSGMNMRLTMLLSPILYGTLALGYLLWIRRYFAPRGESKGE